MFFVSLFFAILQTVVLLTAGIFSLGGSTSPPAAHQMDPAIFSFNKLCEVSDRVKTVVNGKKGLYFYFRRRRSGGEAVSPIGEPLVVIASLVF